VAHTGYKKDNTDEQIFFNWLGCMPDFIKHGDFNKFILIVYFLDGHSPHTL
jgi:hypothetical protein